MRSTAPSALGTRLRFLDELRGVAASAVVLAHVAPTTSPYAAWVYISILDLGQFGVVLFFLCSGFVIPATIEREGSVGAFWIKRFFRLYPLFWLSLLCTAALAAAHIKENGDLTRQDWLANLSMIPGVFGADLALPPYWTLSYEMAFYLFVTALVALRLNRLSVEASLITSCAGIFLALVMPMPAANGPLNASVFWIGTMLTGAVIYRWHAGDIRTLPTVACVSGSLLVGLATAGTSLFGVANDHVLLHSHFWPIVVAWFGAYATFFVFLVVRRRSATWLVYLGTISYSMYLMHEIVLILVPHVGPPILTIAIGFALSVGVSSLTYRFLEAPAIAAGRGCANRYKERRSGAVDQVVEIAKD